MFKLRKKFRLRKTHIAYESQRKMLSHVRTRALKFQRLCSIFSSRKSNEARWKYFFPRNQRSRFRYLRFAFDDRDPFFTRPLRFSSIIGAALEPPSMAVQPRPPPLHNFPPTFVRAVCLGGGEAIKSRTDIGIRGNLQRAQTCFSSRVSRILIERAPFYPPRKFPLERIILSRMILS